MRNLVWPPSTSTSSSAVAQLLSAPGQTISSGLTDLDVDGAGVVSDLLQVGLALTERRDDPGEAGLTALCGLETGPGVELTSCSPSGSSSTSGDNLY